MRTNGEVRTRFAPSPSGFLHVGGARTALFNYLYARAQKGKLILRVEDTDQERSTPESERIIMESLQWLGIVADESPDLGGPCAPYRQSERLDVYTKYTDQLVAKKKAYPCFCNDEHLTASQARSKAMGVPHVYDGKCYGLTPEEIQERKDAGQSFAVRFRVEPSEVVVQDLVQGRVKFDTRLIGDFIIVKSDGFPSYNYAVVVDDYEMRISHVVRGVGHLSNTPRQIIIHEALGLELPAYAHISEIVGTDKKKLSKRRGATSVLFFRELGYIPEAFVNYMALLGWYPGDGVEFMPEGQMGEKFDFDRCSKSSAMFDFFLVEKGSGEQDFDPSSLSREQLQKLINKKTKLNWLNNKYIRHLPLEDLWPLASSFIAKNETLAEKLKSDQDRLRRIFDSLRVYLNTLEDITPYMVEMLREDVAPEDAAALAILEPEQAQAVIAAYAGLLKEKRPVSPEDFSALVKEAGARTGAKGKSLFMPVRVAATGSMQGLELPSLFALLGFETVLSRIEKCIKK